MNNIHETVSAKDAEGFAVSDDFVEAVEERIGMHEDSTEGRHTDHTVTAFVSCNPPVSLNFSTTVTV